MSGYTKLAPEILQSSIWNEPAEIRIVWITLLAAKDQDGYVRGDARTISRLANVPSDITEKALTMFQQPDANSHTPDNEGRRISAENGGFIVLNHLKYRELGMSEDRKEYWRKKQKEHRESKTVNDMSMTCPRQRVSVSVSDSVSGIKKGDARGKQTDDEWLAELAEKFATLGVDVNEQRIKAEAWVSTKPERSFTRRFFVNWLARCETKMQTSEKPSETKTLAKPATIWELSQRKTALESEAESLCDQFNLIDTDAGTKHPAEYKRFLEMRKEIRALIAKIGGSR